jgi:hypothetical protein
MSVNGHTNGTNGAATARRSSIGQAKLLQSPPRRHLSLLRRPSSSSRGGAGTPLDGRGEYFFDLDEFDDTKDHRVGRYDTSKKQRIPSWCDRVLYRTHIIPDEDDDDAVTDDDASSRYRQAGPFHRLSHAFSNLGDHLLFRRRSGFDIGASPERSQRERDSEGQLSSSPIREFEPASADSMRSRRSLSASPELVLNSPRESVSVALNSPRRESAQGILGTRESTPGVVAVPVAVARDATSASDTTSATAATPADEQPQPRMPNSRSITFDAITTPARPRMGSDGAIAIAGATTAAAAESVGAGVAGSLPLESRMPTSPSSPLAPRRASSTDSTPSRRRASVGVATGGSIARRASASSRRGSVGPSLRRRLTDGAVANVPLAALTTVKSTGHSLADAQGGTPNGTGTNGTVTGPRKRRLSIDTRERRMSGAEPTGMNMFARFLRDLPGRLHSRVSLFHGTDATDDEPRRRLAGEVEVLYYGTIDDAG